MIKNITVKQMPTQRWAVIWMNELEMAVFETEADAWNYVRETWGK